MHACHPTRYFVARWAIGSSTVPSMAGGEGLVIVGGGLSTARAIKGYREAGGEGPITLFSRDTKVPYHRPPLSKRYLRGEVEAPDTFVEPEAFYREHDVDVHLETTVSELDPGERTLTVDGSGSKRYDKLLIASGAFPRRLDVPGAELEGVHTLRRLDDSTGIREAAQGARHAVVVGAGFIGMEVAASLKQLGLEVTLVHRGQGLFEVLRARHVEQFLQELYGERGVELVLADEISSFNGFSKLDSVETKRGRVAQAELAVVGIGVAPWTDWLETSGLELDDGVVVNERFETGAEGVWAVGDVARFYDPIFEKHRRIEHWSNANYGGEKVGQLMAGNDGRVRHRLHLLLRGLRLHVPAARRRRRQRRDRPTGLARRRQGDRVLSRATTASWLPSSSGRTTRPRRG